MKTDTIRRIQRGRQAGTAILAFAALLLWGAALAVDAESTELTKQEKLDKGITLSLSGGGWEPDYTKKAVEGMIGYKGMSSLHLFAGGGWADQIYYERTKYYAKGYYFYRDNSYLKLYGGFKRYTYPNDATLQRPNPDTSSYEDVPNVEIEISHWFGDSFRGSVFVEYFSPTFFHDPASRADNIKAGVEAYYLTPIDGLRAKVMYATLRDPDPNKTEIKGRNNTSTPAGTATQTDIVYRTTDLLGGALEIAGERMQAEVKYMPNRDLDNSYDYSLLIYGAYRFTDGFTGRADYVYDKYSKDSNLAGKTANVYMLSASIDATESTTLGIGAKYIDLPVRNDWTGFVMLTYKTGVVF